ASQSQASYLQSPEEQFHIPRRNKALSRFPAQNRSIWRYSTPSKSLSGSSDYSRNSDTTLATKTPFIRDSQSAIALAHNPEHHARTKHIDIQYHVVRNCVEDGRLRLEYCPTEDMVADGLTKALGPERQKKLTRKMGLELWKERDK